LKGCAKALTFSPSIISYAGSRVYKQAFVNFVIGTMRGAPLLQEWLGEVCGVRYFPLWRGERMVMLWQGEELFYSFCKHDSAPCSVLPRLTAAEGLFLLAWPKRNKNPRLASFLVKSYGNLDSGSLQALTLAYPIAPA